MRKLLLLFCLFPGFISVEAQFMMKADLYNQRTRKDTLSEFPEFNKSVKDSTMIIFSKDSVLYVNDAQKVSYKINRILKWSNGMDIDDGDKWTGFMSACTDDAGVTVRMIMMKYDSGIILISVLYGNFEFRYQCHKYKYPPII